jgi:hypothetical protein
MPGRDRTGPEGEGPRSGRALGPCGAKAKQTPPEKEEAVTTAHDTTAKDTTPEDTTPDRGPGRGFGWGRRHHRRGERGFGRGLRNRQRARGGQDGAS